MSSMGQRDTNLVVTMKTTVSHFAEIYGIKLFHFNPSLTRGRGRVQCDTPKEFFPDCTKTSKYLNKTLIDSCKFVLCGHFSEKTEVPP